MTERGDKYLKKQQVMFKDIYFDQLLSNSEWEDYSGRRFYHDLCAPYPYEPTRDLFGVVYSTEKGEGLITLTCFEPGDKVFRFFGIAKRVQTLYTLQKAPGIYIEDPIVMGKVLHSCNPNMICDMETQTFIAIKHIKSGQYLTMDYETTEDALFRAFECGCGNKNCRGLIQGKKR